MPSTDQLDAFTQIVRRLGMLYTRIAAQQSAAHNTLSKSEWLTIGVLGVQGPSRMGAIAEYLGVGQSAVTPTIDRLEAEGLVQRRRSEQDRRVWLVELTDGGDELLVAENAIYQQMAAEMLAPLTPDEQATLVRLLTKVSTPDEAIRGQAV